MKPPVLGEASTDALHALAGRVSSLLIAAESMIEGSSPADQSIAQNVACDLLIMARELADELVEWG